MVDARSLVLGAMGLGASLLYIWVARLQMQRRVSPEARGARDGFALWWAVLAVVGVYSAVTGIVGWGIQDLGLIGARLVLYGLVALLLAACGGLVYYLLYLYTGSRSWRLAVSAYFAAIFAFFIWLQEAHDPVIGPDPAAGGEVTFHLAQEPAVWASLGLSLGLVLPLLASAASYGMLFFRTQDRTARYRILMVSSGLVLWFTFSTFNSVVTAFADAEPGFVRSMVGQALGVLAAVLVLLAYDPPEAWRRRFGLRRVDQVAQPVQFESGGRRLSMV